MADEFTSYSVDNDRKFRETIERVSKDITDLRIPFRLISNDFYKSQKAIWQLKSPGLYPDLAESTKADRRRRNQPLYPILKRTGMLERSTTNPNDGEAINEVTKTTLTIGSKVKYGIFHQQGTKHMPMRKFLFIGPEAPRFANDQQKGRLERWTGILNAFALEKARQLGEAR